MINYNLSIFTLCLLYIPVEGLKYIEVQLHSIFDVVMDKFNLI